MHGGYKQMKWSISVIEFIAIVLFYGFAFLLMIIKGIYAIGYIVAVVFGSIWIMYCNSLKNKKKQRKR